MKYPREISGGSELNKAIGSIDLLPTLAYLTQTSLPKNEIDGKNAWPLISGHKDAKNRHDYYPFSIENKFEGVISGDGRWKLHMPHKYKHVLEPGKDGMPGDKNWPMIKLSLFDLENDPSESNNLINKFPDIAAKLKGYAARHKKRFYE